MVLSLRQTAAALMLVAAAVTGCSGDPTAATKPNFEAAINKAMAADPCVTLPPGVGDKAFPIFEEGKGSSLMRSLTKVGVFSSKAARGPAIGLFPPADGTSFELTDRGRPYVKFGTRSRGQVLGDKEVAKICLGTPKVTEIISFTEPADKLGVRVTNVSFRYNIVDYPSWAAPAMPGEPIEAKMALVATSDGWVPGED